ncbi:hypothetical protein K438DRAFT_2016517 [Mycena galopus ATCC 62051]|nr:hypothetical protein K438DRAFT_2016517 [Mycena galopus ATCC 62051]
MSTDGYDPDPTIATLLPAHMPSKPMKPKSTALVPAPAPAPPPQPVVRSARKRVPSAKAKSQKKKKSNKTPDTSDDSANEDDQGACEVDWKNDVELSTTMVALIGENAEIKQSLFPPCGPNASSQKGGGKPKTNAQWQLAVLLFGSMEKFKDAIAACTTAAQKRVWANKIKNRLVVMAKLTRGFNKEMGETGAGIRNASEINTDVTNKLTTKWAEIGKKCPWYFEMRELIGQRPNVVFTGLGHSGTPIAGGVILPEEEPVDVDEHDELDSTRSGSPIPEGWEPTPEPESRKRTFHDMDDEGAGAGSGDDYDPASELILASTPIPFDASEGEGGEGDGDDDGGSGEGGQAISDVEEPQVDIAKPKAKTGAKIDRKNPAKPAMSKPAAAAPAAAPKPAKKPKIAEFADIMKNEEQTRQKELDLAALRARVQLKTTEVKGRALDMREQRKLEDRRGKREERMMKLRMKELEMKHKHELRMQAARADPLSSASHAASFFGSHSSVSSQYTHSEPDYGFDTDAMDSLAGNAVAGPSGVEDYSDFHSFADAGHKSSYGT